MNRPFRTVFSLLAGAALALTAVPIHAYEEAPPPSGFLGDYSMLKSDPAEKDARMIYHNPEYPITRFDSLYLEDVVFLLYPSDEAVEIDPEEAAKMIELAAEFDEAFREEVAKQGVRLVDAPGPGVLSCRWAITNLGKSRSVSRILPVGRLVGAGRGSVAMEAECVDSETGDVVGQVIKASKGKRSSGVTTWAGAKSAVRQWAKDLAGRFADSK